MQYPSNIIAMTLLTVLAAAAQEPRLAKGLSAMNAGSYTPAGLPGYGVAAGARFVLLGSDFGVAEPVEQQSPDSASLAGVTAKVTVGGASVDAPVMYVSATRVEALLPNSATLGKGTVTVNINGMDLTAPIEVVESAPGIRTRGSMGSGTAFAYNASGNEISAINPAVPGDVIRIRTTGIGSEAALAATSILVGGKAVPAAGITRLGSGFDDIDFEMPATELGCGVSVAIRTGIILSNFASLPVGTRGTPCTDRFAPAGTDYEKLLREGARVGYISLGRSEISDPQFRIQTDTGSGSFFAYTPQTLSNGEIYSSALTSGSCTVLRPINIEGVPMVPYTPLDAGPQLTVNGPGGGKNMPLLLPGIYSGQLGEKTEFNIPGIQLPGTGVLYLEPGAYTVAGTGGAEVGAFTAQLTVLPAITWTNSERIGAQCGDFRCVDRAQDLRIEWQGGDDKRWVTVMGFSTSTTTDPASVAFFTCMERSDRGSLTVPPAILSALPASSGEGSILSFSVSPIGEGTQFSAPGIDWGIISYVQTKSIRAGYR